MKSLCSLHEYEKTILFSVQISANSKKVSRTFLFSPLLVSIHLCDVQLLISAPRVINALRVNVQSSQTQLCCTWNTEDFILAKCTSHCIAGSPATVATVGQLAKASLSSDGWEAAWQDQFRQPIQCSFSVHTQKSFFTMLLDDGLHQDLLLDTPFRMTGLLKCAEEYFHSWKLQAVLFC